MIQGILSNSQLALLFDCSCSHLAACSFARLARAQQHVAFLVADPPQIGNRSRVAALQLVVACVVWIRRRKLVRPLAKKDLDSTWIPESAEGKVRLLW